VGSYYMARDPATAVEQPKHDLQWNRVLIIDLTSNRIGFDSFESRKNLCGCYPRRKKAARRVSSDEGARVRVGFQRGEARARGPAGSGSSREQSTGRQRLGES
jgi:hypothetical protein